MVKRGISSLCFVTWMNSSQHQVLASKGTTESCGVLGINVCTCHLLLDITVVTGSARGSGRDNCGVLGGVICIPSQETTRTPLLGQLL
ncbi:hypothetical protein DsansV1_C19g0155721 [Dioscorea sansibarensis]